MLNKLLTAIIATCFVLTIMACRNVDTKGTKEPAKEEKPDTPAIQLVTAIIG